MSEVDYCYHCHTARCGHARGEDEEYVLAAIKKGIKVLGFSDHVMLPGRSQPGIRGDYEELEGYIKSITSLREKYKDQIEIHLGFEAEYYPDEVEYYKSLLKDGRIEYLIMGQHCYYNKDFHWYDNGRDPLGGVIRYLKDSIEGLKTGLFSYMCHPDLFTNYFGDVYHPEVASLIEKLCFTAKKMGIPMEINMGPARYMPKANVPGMRKDEADANYPYPPFWEFVRKAGNKAIIGVDAHSPDHFDRADFAWAKSYIDYYGLEEVTRLTFRKGK